MNVQYNLPPVFREKLLRQWSKAKAALSHIGPRLRRLRCFKTLADVAMFFAGLCVYLQLELCLLPSTHAACRLGVSEASVGRFLAYIFTAQCLMATAAMYTGSALVFLDKKYENFSRYISIPVVWGFTVSFGTVWRFSAFGDFRANAYKYSWTLIASGALFGLSECLCLKVGAEYTSSYEMGAATLTGTVAFFVSITKAYFERKGMNVDYWMMTSQSFGSFIWAIITGVTWTVFVVLLLQRNKALKDKYILEDVERAIPIEHDGSSVYRYKLLTPFQAFKNALSPFLMTQFGLGPMFLYYPTMAPIELIDLRHAYDIQLYCKFIETFSGIAAWCLSELGVLSRCWSGKYSYWHFLWLLLIPDFFNIVTINLSMHYPDSWVGRAVRNKMAPVLCITMLYVLVRCVLEYVGFAGLFHNALGEPEDTKLDALEDQGESPREIYESLIKTEDTARNMNVVNNWVANSLTTLLLYCGEGYCAAYNDYKTAMASGQAWPTANKNIVSAWFFWAGQGIGGGFKNLSTTFTRKLEI